MSANPTHIARAPLGSLPTHGVDPANAALALPGAVTLPLRTISELNGSHGHWSTSVKRRRRQRQTAKLLCPAWGLPGVITLTRLSAGTLDDDNLRAALKSVRDGIADKLGIKDNDPRVTWEYAQEKCPRKTYGVRIEWRGL